MHQDVTLRKDDVKTSRYTKELRNVIEELHVQLISLISQ
jgi:hypothetical protein